MMMRMSSFKNKKLIYEFCCKFYFRKKSQNKKSINFGDGPYNFQKIREDLISRIWAKFAKSAEISPIKGIQKKIGLLNSAKGDILPRKIESTIANFYTVTAKRVPYCKFYSQYKCITRL